MILGAQNPTLGFSNVVISRACLSGHPRDSFPPRTRLQCLCLWLPSEGTGETGPSSGALPEGQGEGERSFWASYQM